MESLGSHLIIDFYECDSERLNDASGLESVMVNATRQAGATIVSHTFHAFSPHGVTGVISIAESHVSIHTWPEYGYAAVDIFTCGEAMEPWRIEEALREHLKSQSLSSMDVKRGRLRLRPGQRVTFKPDFSREALS